MLTDKDKLIVTRHLQIALGFMQVTRTLLRASAQEPDIRTGLSRLYYAFFHAGFALLCFGTAVSSALQVITCVYTPCNHAGLKPLGLQSFLQRIKFQGQACRYMLFKTTS